MIDLRSDTVTRPTAAMRRAMAEAEVGDDVYREDPTVAELESLAAELTGKEAALFVPSGTMGNTIAIKLHTRHGQEVICDSRSHILDYELAMMAWFAGCVPRAIATSAGLLDWDGIRAVIKPLGPHWAPTGLIAVENTHNMGGGRVYPLQALQAIYAGAKEHSLPVHMDGARVFNAAAALGVPVSRIAGCADTIMFCLSKGLGAPVGSMLAGKQDMIAEARLLRKRLGGGMRQAGVLAAAGLIALRDMTGRLVEDHRNAKRVAHALCEIPGIELNPENVETNIVIFDVAASERTGQEISAELKRRGVLINAIGGQGPRGTRMRIVTHFDVDAAMCDKAVDALRDVLGASRTSVGAESVDRIDRSSAAGR